MKVRDALPGDAPLIAGVEVRSWRAAYRGLLPDSYLDAMTESEGAARWQRAIAASAAKERPILVAEEDEAVIAYAVVGADADDASRGLLFLLYADPVAWGTGAGHALMVAAISRLRERDVPEVRLWVLEANSRARCFYERHGWTADGATNTSTFDGVAFPALRYSIAL